jgi:putative oxidoreductase
MLIRLLARLLLGLLLVATGLNGFFHFLHLRAAPAGLAAQFVGALAQSHYLYVVSAIQVLCGLLLVFNRFVPLALVIAGPIVFNIILYHVFLLPEGFGPAVVVTALWVIAFVAYREYFSSIFVQNAR